MRALVKSGLELGAIICGFASPDTVGRVMSALELGAVALGALPEPEVRLGRIVQRAEIGVEQGLRSLARPRALPPQPIQQQKDVNRVELESPFDGVRHAVGLVERRRTRLSDDAGVQLLTHGQGRAWAEEAVQEHLGLDFALRRRYRRH